jgi:dihydroorotase
MSFTEFGGGNPPHPHAKPESSAPRIEVPLPDDWHLHLRDGAALRHVVLASALQFGRAIVMPNLKPPVVRCDQALAYRTRIQQALRAAVADARSSGSPNDQLPALRCSPERRAWLLGEALRFEPLMTLYLTDHTTPADIDAAADSGLVHAVKLYPAGATTHADAGVSEVERLGPVFERMQSRSLPLLVHGEVTDADIDVFDREAVFIDRVMVGLRARFPALRIVFEHITTRQAAQFVRDAEGPTAATITPQHLLYNRNAIFRGGLRPHWYCLPVLKREVHRQALLEAAISGLPRFFLGTDSAPHAARLKEHAAACAGCYSAPHALALYATAFEAAGALDRLADFAAVFGARFYSLEPHTRRVGLLREPSEIPHELPFGRGNSLVPLAAGEHLPWRFEGLIGAATG